jgi:asparagine synthetase B (glutamine-hydrolysing)
MDTVAAVYDPRAQPADTAHALRRMRQALDVPSARARADGTSGAAAGCVLLGYRAANAARAAPWIARDDSRGVWLAFAGELYDPSELRTRAPGEADAAAGDAALCLRLYLREGADFVRRLNGHFNVIIYREADRHMSIATDPFGYRPLFLARDGHRLLFASEMKAILAVLDSPPAVDGVGLLQLARQGFALGERTWLESIQVAAAGTWYEMTPHGMTTQRYFRFRFHRGDAAASLPSYVEGFAHQVRRAMQRATAAPARIGIGLSGGLDSRTLLLAADRAVHPLLAYTFGHADSRDVRYAAQLARIAGVAHLHLTYDAGYLGHVLAPIVWRTEGLLPFAEATFTGMYFHDRLATHVDALLYGHGGDALTGGHLPQRVPLWRSRERLMEHVFRQYNRAPEAMMQRVFHPSFYRRFASALYESLRATFADIDQDELTDVLNVWDIENRQRRCTFASTVVDRGRFGVYAPFLDRDLVEHLCQAPPWWRLQQFAYKRMIVTAFPQAAAAPWSHTGGRLRTQPIADFADQARSYLQRRVRRTCGQQPSPRNDPYGFRNLSLDTRGDPRLAGVIREFAASSLFPGEIFDRRGIEEVVSRHWEGGEDLTHLVSMLATFATAFRLLLWQQPGTNPAEAASAV